MLYFGRSSKERLETCHPLLQELCKHALNQGIIDFSVICGHRTKEEQDKLYPKYTKVQFPNSKHNSLPSKAVDLYPYHPKYKTLTGHPTQLEEIALEEFKEHPPEVGYALAKGFIQFEYGKLAGVILSSSKELGIDVRWGGDFNGNLNSLDESFIDLPHFELL